jgi:hypothetical protein
MLISQDPKLLFVHVQKTGGSSLAAVLPGARPFLGTHDHARRARDVLGSDYDAYFKFAFVRNPWDRLVSWYSMIVQQSRGRPPASLNRLWRYVLDTASTFEEFVLRCTEAIDDVDGRKSFLYNQLDYVSDETGVVIVDFVGRYESFDDDVRQVFRRLGLPEPSLPRLNRSRHDHYRTFYSPHTRDVVAERYRRDIERFGYQF